MKRPTIAGFIAVAAAIAVATAVWATWFRAPYALAGSPTVDVTVTAQKSKYPDVAQTRDEVDTLLHVYVQRLKARDTDGLLAIDIPGSQAGHDDAQKLIDRFSDGAQGHMDAVVEEAVTDYRNSVRLTFRETGETQSLLLEREYDPEDPDQQIGDTWWISLDQSQ